MKKTTLLLLALSTLLASCSHEAVDPNLENADQTSDRASLDAYLKSTFIVSAESGPADARITEATNQVISGSEMFNRGAFAAVGIEKMPYILFRLLPELAQKLEGRAVFGSTDAGFENFGLFKDSRREDWPTPLGFTWTVPSAENNQVSYVIRTCANCHVGRVNVDDKTYLLEGSANHEYDFHDYTTTWLAFVDKWFAPKNRDYTEEAIVSLLLEKQGNVDWYYNNQSSYDAQGKAVRFDKSAAQAQIDSLSSRLAEVTAEVYEVNKFRLGINQSIEDAFHQIADNPQSIKYGPPGIADSNSNGIHSFVAAHNAKQAEKGEALFDVGSLFKGSTKVSIPSVWQQGRRHAAQWTASVISPLFRNVIAAAGFGAEPATLNALNLQVVTQYIAELPPPVFPGSIDTQLAEEGRLVYEQAQCATCHVADHDLLDTPNKIPRVFNIGSSDNRARSSTPGLGPIVVGAVLPICTQNPRNGTMSVTIDGTTEAPCKIDPFTDLVVPRNAEVGTGYPAAPLDGIWARAPYLNNGSVPTLYHLLASSYDQSTRPSEFFRGSANYDMSKLGWEWDKDKADASNYYDTSLDSFANTGHDGFGTKGIWTDPEDASQQFKLTWDTSIPAEKKKLASLLEYLKTL